MLIDIELFDYVPIFANNLVSQIASSSMLSTESVDKYVNEIECDV